MSSYTAYTSNISSPRCSRLEMRVLSLERDELQYYSMEQPHHFPLASENTGRRLQDTWKNRLAGLKHRMPKLSLPWNVIWECVWKWERITERSRWQESVPKTREERNRSMRKKECLRTYGSVVRLGSVCSPDMKSPASVLWRAMRARSKGQETVGKRRGAEVDRAQTGAKRSRIKQEKRHKDQREGSS